jgi:hypothetical protein
VTVLRYFGERWDAPIMEGAIEVPVPGGACMWCDEGFEHDDSGWVWANGPAAHLECALRQVLGGVNHQLGLCTCCGGTRDPDPPGLTQREAARAAMKLHTQRGFG